MPIYEYDCPKCGTFEVSRKMSDPTLETHDTCGEKVQRRISLSSFSLKGGGWYADGYKATGGSSSSSSDSGGGCASGACGTGACPAMA